MATKTHYTGEEPRKNQCLWKFRQLHGRARRNFRRPKCGTKRNDKIGTAETQTRRTNNRIYTKLRVTHRKSCNNRRENSDPIPREEDSGESYSEGIRRTDGSNCIQRLSQQGSSSIPFGVTNPAHRPGTIMIATNHYT